MLLLLLLPLAASTPVAAQQGPATFRAFLSQYRGKEILLLDRKSELLRFDDADSSSKFVVVLDEVDEDSFIVHRGPPEHVNSSTYSLASIRRVTYLYNGRPYKRILVESE
jgi:hypothetical protein